MTPFGFLRARGLAKDLQELAHGADSLRPAERAAVMRDLLAQIGQLCDHREPIRETGAELEASIAAHLDGLRETPRGSVAGGHYPELSHLVTKVALAIEIARVGVEQGKPELYFKDPHHDFVPVPEGSRAEVVSIETVRRRGG